MNELQQLEATIEAGLATFRQVGDALKRIRSKGLYRAGHPTWEAYCKARWGFSGRRANQLIAACKVGQRLGTMVPKNTPASQTPVAPGSPATNERQARRLLEQLTATDRPTAAQLRQARESIEQMTPEEKFAAASTAEAKALTQLSRLDQETTVEKIMRLCGRLQVLHATLPCADAASRALDAYLGVIRA